MTTIFRGGIDLFMRVNILILLGCILPSLMSSSDEQDDDGPIRLTENALGEHRAIEYIIWDQCMLQPGHQSVNSFRMAFYQPEHFFCDNDGLLICYPSQLGQNNMVNGMVANVQYQIRIPENNLVAQRCEAKRAEFCKNGQNAEHCKPGGIASIPWGGILVYTHPDHLDPMKTQIRLNLSVTNIGFELGLHQRILIKFGRKDAMNKTTVFAPGKRLHFEIDEQLGEEFIRNVHKGAWLRNYQGLWMLGLDILPTKHVEQIHFFVYRHSKCAMQSWFLYPYEERNMRMWIPKLEMGSGDWLNQHQEENVITLLGSRTDLGPDVWPLGKRVITWLLSNCKASQVEIRLVDNPTSGKQIRLEFHVSKVDGIVFTDSEFGKWDPFECRGNLSNKFLQCHEELQVEIILHGFFFEAILTKDEMSIKNRFWPDGWWMPLRLQNATLEVNGDAFQGRVQVENVEDNLESPHSQKLKWAITNGTKFTFRAKIKNAAKSIQINMLHDAPEWHESIGATVLHFQVDFLSDEQETLTSWGAYDSGNKWYDNGTYYSNATSPFLQVAFECSILVEEILNNEKRKNEIHFTIEANNQLVRKAINSKLPMWTLNWIQITGDLLELTVPVVEYTNDTSGMYKHELEHLFAVGDILCIEGQTKAMPNNNGYFEINLFHESNEFSKEIGDTVMQANFYFNVLDGEYPNQIVFQRYYHYLRRWEFDLKKRDNPWTVMGQKFIIKIIAAEDKFEMEINGQKSDVYSYEYSKDENAMPPWAANWLMLKGDLEWVKIANESEECMRQNATQKPLPPHIKQLDPVRALQLGDSISIEAEISIADSEKPQILVGLYREAFEWRPIIGHTVLQATFTESHVSLTSYIGQQWKVNNSIGEYVHEIGTPISKLEKFELKISVTEEGYQLNGNALAKQLEYPRFVPLWAVQYISVQGDVKKETVSIGIKEGNEEMAK